MSESLRLPARACEVGKPGLGHFLADWLPLCVLPPIALAAGSLLQPWIEMWALAASIFAGFKWATWRMAPAGGAKPSAFRSCVYLLLWPGMDARRFLASGSCVVRPTPVNWIWALAKTGFGACLLWGIARLAGNAWAAGWIGMVGLIFVLHFGAFDLLALFWRRLGIDAQPLMRNPANASSLADFWSRRWNTSFRDLAFGLMFRRLSGSLGARAALMATFVWSGLIHDIVISLPSGGGYGLPTAYFVIQGAGLLVERTGIVRGLGPLLRRTFAIAVVILPLGMLFPPPFVERVIVPFMHAINAI